MDVHTRVPLLSRDPPDPDYVVDVDTPTVAPIEDTASITRLIARIMWWNHCVLVVLLVGFVVFLVKLKGAGVGPKENLVSESA